MSQEFFKKMQNKIHYAIHGHTAAELIVERADAEKDFIFSRNRFLARKPCVAASSVDLCDVFGWKYDTVVCKFNVKQCI